ncbi:hypothetical protein GCM10023074_48850 [Microbispora amethystogenes]
MIARATVRPPTPLSKIPIALLLSSGTLPKVRGPVPAADGKKPHNARGRPSAAAEPGELA